MIKLVKKFAKCEYISHPKNCHKTFKILPKWRIFSKSGHTALDVKKYPTPNAHAISWPKGIEKFCLKNATFEYILGNH